MSKVPECDCGEPMTVERGIAVDVYRCASGACRSEGFRGPVWKLASSLRRLTANTEEA